MSKESVDVVDLPELQRRGVLRKLPEKPSQELSKKFHDGYFDMSRFDYNRNLEVNPDISTEATSQQTETNPFSFLDNLAAASSSETQTQTISQTSQNINFQDLKVKLEDLEYKLERFIDRLTQLEAQLEKLDKNQNKI